MGYSRTIYHNKPLILDWKTRTGRLGSCKIILFIQRSKETRGFEKLGATNFSRPLRSCMLFVACWGSTDSLLRSRLEWVKTGMISFYPWFRCSQKRFLAGFFSWWVGITCIMFVKDLDIFDIACSSWQDFPQKILKSLTKAYEL